MTFTDAVGTYALIGLSRTLWWIANRIIDVAVPISNLGYLVANASSWVLNNPNRVPYLKRYPTP